LKVQNLKFEIENIELFEVIYHRTELIWPRNHEGVWFEICDMPSNYSIKWNNLY